MLDLRWILANRKEAERFLRNRRHDFDLGVLESLDGRRRRLIAETEELKARRNEGSRKVGEAKRSGTDASALMEEIRLMGDGIRERDSALAEVEDELKRILMTLPNRLHESTPVGVDENDNPVVRSWGAPKDFGFEPRPHWELGEDLGIMDFEKGVMLAQSRLIEIGRASCRERV